MIRVILILAVLGVLVWGLRWFMRTAPQEIATTLRGRGGVLLLAVLILLAVLAHSWLVPLLGAAGAVVARSLPYLPRLWPLLERIWQQNQFRHQSEAENPASGASAMPSSRAEAYEVLGLKPGATEKEVIAAHRRLMQKVHPDRGGSDFLAAQINRAKEILLASQK